MKTTDIPFLRGDVMPESKPGSAPKPVAPKEASKPAGAELVPAGQSTNPAVHQLLAELETARANGADDDAEDIVLYLAELGYSAG